MTRWSPARDWAGGALGVVAFSVSALILNYVLRRADLVPRWLASWGLAAAVLYLATGVMVLYGLEPLSATQTLLQLPLAVQEMVFAIWLIVKGFNPTVLDAPRRASRPTRHDLIPHQHLNKGAIVSTPAPYPVQLEFHADRHITRWRPLVQWLLAIRI